MKITIHSVSFVKFSDVVSGISDETVEAIASHIGNSVTWGDANHTLIEAQHILANLDIDEGDEAEFVEFRKRLMELPRFCMVDMEH